MGLLRDPLGVDLSEGTIQATCERVSSAVAATLEDLEAALPGAAQVFLDETGWKQHGVRHWLGSASTARFAGCSIHRRRSGAQVRAWLPDEAHGVVSAERWSAYSHLEPVRRQLCWAHLDRDSSPASCPSGPPARSGESSSSTG